MVEAEEFHIVKPRARRVPLTCIARDAMVAKLAQGFGKVHAIRRHHPALAGRQMLYRMEAEHRQVRDAARVTSVIFGAQRVASVLDDGEAMQIGRASCRE